MTERPASLARLTRGFPLWLLAVATFGFIWLVTPFFSTILWAVIVSVLFAPLNRRLTAKMPQWPGSAALITLLVILAVVVLPAMLLGFAILEELASFHARLRADQIDLGQIALAAQSHLPRTVRLWLSEFGLGDITTIRSRLNQNLAGIVQPAVAQIVYFGQGTLGFFLGLGVMLYLTFFLLRDGGSIVRHIDSALPLTGPQFERLGNKFVAVVRATIKGSLIVAILQGTIGGLTFWALGLQGALLWGVAMGVLSLLPAIGTGLVWVPATIYLLATGAVWQGTALGLCGFFIISSIDNLVRPILVGRDTQMPDYVVLIATLGGFELMGFNGFIIGPVIAAFFFAVWDLFGLHGAEQVPPPAPPSADLVPPDPATPPPG